MGNVAYAGSLEEQEAPKIEETVSVKKSRLKELEEAEAKLLALEGAGVDNWEGYGEALEALEQQ